MTRELAQPFDPDNLPCSARLADFVIATEQRLKNQLMMPGQTFAYPLKLLSNQGYQGTVSLKVTSTPADPRSTCGSSRPAVAVDRDLAGHADGEDDERVAPGRP